ALPLCSNWESNGSSRALCFPASPRRDGDPCLTNLDCLLLDIRYSLCTLTSAARRCRLARFRATVQLISCRPSCPTLKCEMSAHSRELSGPSLPFQYIREMAQPTQARDRFSALTLPRILSVFSSKLTFWPSARPESPARSTALICTNTSLPPSLGWIKPKP